MQGSRICGSNEYTPHRSSRLSQAPIGQHGNASETTRDKAASVSLLTFDVACQSGKCLACRNSSPRPSTPKSWDTRHSSSLLFGKKTPAQHIAGAVQSHFVQFDQSLLQTTRTLVILAVATASSSSPIRPCFRVRRGGQLSRFSVSKDMADIG